jgi:hypothetical protein
MNQHVKTPWYLQIAKTEPVIIGDPENDPLDAFISWFFNNIGPMGRVPLLNAVHRIDDVTSVLWFRQGPFQVQLFIAPPNKIIPEHIHPNVDSYEVYVGGCIKFSKNKEWVASEEDFLKVDDSGLPKLRGMLVRVKPDEWHGGVAGPDGSAFFSVQHWLNDVEPHCVACDYTGPVMGEDHMGKVKFGNPVLKNKLNINDALDHTQDVGS